MDQVTAVLDSAGTDLKPFITGRIALEDLVEQGFDTLINHKVRRVSLGQRIGRIDSKTMVAVEQSLAVFLGLGR